MEQISSRCLLVFLSASQALLCLDPSVMFSGISPGVGRRQTAASPYSPGELVLGCCSCRGAALPSWGRVLQSLEPPQLAWGIKNPVKTPKAFAEGDTAKLCDFKRQRGEPRHLSVAHQGENLFWDSTAHVGLGWARLSLLLCLT